MQRAPARQRAPYRGCAAGAASSHSAAPARAAITSQIAAATAPNGNTNGVDRARRCEHHRQQHCADDQCHDDRHRSSRTGQLQPFGQRESQQCRHHDGKRRRRPHHRADRDGQQNRRGSNALLQHGRLACELRSIGNRRPSRRVVRWSCRSGAAGWQTIRTLGRARPRRTAATARRRNKTRCRQVDTAGSC